MPTPSKLQLDKKPETTQYFVLACVDAVKRDLERSSDPAGFLTLHSWPIRACREIQSSTDLLCPVMAAKL